MSNDAKPQLGEFCWNELMTSDTKKAQDFYTALFGWKTQNHDMGDMSYTMFMAGEKGIGGMMQIPKDKAEHIQPHWMSYVSVENLEKSIEKAKSLGASVTVPTTEVAGMGRFSIIADPTGAHIALWQVVR